MPMAAADNCASNAACSTLAATPSKTSSKTSSKRANIEKKVREVIAEVLCIDEKEITLKSDIYKDLGADSIDAVELIMEYEKIYDITIPDADAEKILTVGDAVNYLVTHTK